MIYSYKPWIKYIKKLKDSCYFRDVFSPNPMNKTDFSENNRIYMKHYSVLITIFTVCQLFFVVITEIENRLLPDIKELVSSVHSVYILLTEKEEVSNLNELRKKARNIQLMAFESFGRTTNFQFRYTVSKLVTSVICLVMISLFFDVILFINKDKIWHFLRQRTLAKEECQGPCKSSKPNIAPKVTVFTKWWTKLLQTISSELLTCICCNVHCPPTLWGIIWLCLLLFFC